MDRIITDIAEFAAALDFDRLPAAVVSAAKRHLIDTVGCAIGGRGCDAAAMARRIAAGATRPGRILGWDETATAEHAAFINTAMIRYLDFNDTIHGGHPSDCLGGILALAEEAGSDGRRLLGAMIVGYEIACRLIAAMRLREHGWDQGFFVALAAAAGVGHLLRLDADKIAHAVAIAAVGNVPLRVTRAGELSLWKGAATAFACRNGVFAALIAAEGMTGPAAAFTGRHGVFEQMSGEFALTPFADGFFTPAVGLKYWPVENSAQAGVWAAKQLRDRVPLAQIAAIDLATHRAAWHEIGSEPAKWDPQTRETADHSLPYIFARTLVDGAITVRSFDPRAYLDPALRPLMAKIGVRADDAIERLFPSQVVMRVKATDTSDRVHDLEIADSRGFAANPMDDGEIAAKFRGLAAPALGDARSEEALAALGAVERADRLGPLFRLLALRR